MTLKEFVDRCSNKGRDDGLAVASVKLGVKVSTLYSWLHKRRNPSQAAKSLLRSKNIDIE